MTIDELLARARSRLDRIPAEGMADALSSGALVVDIRPEVDRAAEGLMPGAEAIHQNVLLWRLAPSSASRIYDLGDGRPVILFCNDGYSSSLLAAALVDLGVPGATDLIGGYRAWRALQSDG